MPDYNHPLLERIAALNVHTRGEIRSPHKPLLMLIAIAAFARGERDLPFITVEARLRPLLETYAPPVRRPQPELPYWHLRNDRIWELDNEAGLPRQAGGFPRLPALRATRGRLTDDVASQLENTALREEAIGLLLAMNFPRSLHDDIRATIGLSDSPEYVAESVTATGGRRTRDANFRREVLAAYEYRCAATGFRVALSGTYFGCEAAHVRWHAYSGPDTVENGVCLEPTMHKLFDAGAWTLSDDRRVMVSRHFTGDEPLIDRIRRLHGRPVREPIDGPPIAVEFIRWHREANLGGVFRGPEISG